MLQQPVLSVHHLVKKYKDFVAVNDISFTLQKGEILGLLGPNGAGKTTTIQMLLGLTTPTSGSIDYFGQDFTTHREASLSRINFASAYAQLNGRMTVWQNLRIFAGLYEIPQPQKRIDELMELLEITSFRNTLFWHLSSGQQTRAILAKALLNKPELLLMDEPTASLDPDIVDKVVQLVLRLKEQEHVSILYTSHNMGEVTRVCDRVMFLQHGHIEAVDTPVGLTKLVGEAKLVLVFDGQAKVLQEFAHKRGIKTVLLRPDLIEIEAAEDLIPSLLFDISKTGVWITNIEIQKPTLEDVFLSFSRQAERERGKVFGEGRLTEGKLAATEVING